MDGTVLGVLPAIIAVIPSLPYLRIFYLCRVCIHVCECGGNGAEPKQERCMYICLCKCT